LFLAAPAALAFPFLLLTAPSGPPDEAHLLAELLARGVTRLHLRKPGWPPARLEALIQALPPQLHERLVLHGHPELVRRYRLGGLHLTAAGRRATTRRPTLLPGQTLSTSFHSLAEISRHRRRYDYVFLSPIFDSISKENYASAFDLDEVQTFLQKLAARPGYRPAVLALGGIDSQNIALAKQASFAGAAVLGSVWGSADPVAAWQQVAQASAASQSFHTGS
jgi:thiamine-phosphate pyrophosphorylase